VHVARATLLTKAYKLPRTINARSLLSEKPLVPEARLPGILLLGSLASLGVTSSVDYY